MKIGKRSFKLAVILLAGIVIGTGYDFITNIIHKDTGHRTSLSADVYELQDKLVSIGEQASQAVVGVSVTSLVRERYLMNPDQDDLFRFFFGLPERQFRQSGIGSGFIVRKDGYILTNEHVIDKAEDITVLLPNGEKYKAKLTGYDIRSDLAVLKIDAKNLPYIEMGDSDKVKTGQWAIAVGNPFAIFENNPKPTMTLGIISAVHRSLPSSDMNNRYYGDLIQTDAAINPGNSGGPLLNIDGKVIGINVAIISNSGQSAGIGFALPINRAKSILENLIAGKEIKYGWLGVGIQPLSSDLLQNFGLKEKGGILVAEVFTGGPADKAGIKRRDIIVRYDTTPITSPEDFIAMVGQTPIGQKVELEVIRNGKKEILTAVIGERASPKSVAVAQPEKPVSWRGILVEDLTDDIRTHYNLENAQGVIVVGVEPTSPANIVQIREGDVIDEINRVPIKNRADFVSVTRSLKGDVLIHSLNQGYVIIRDEQR